MERTRKLIMRCEHPAACDLCLDDCKRAEVTAHETEIKTDLLAACKALFLRVAMHYTNHQDVCKLGNECPDKKGLILAEAAIAKATG